MDDIDRCDCDGGKTKSLFRANLAKNGTRGTGDQVYKHFFLEVFLKKREVAWSLKKVRSREGDFFEIE